MAEIKCFWAFFWAFYLGVFFWAALLLPYTALRPISSSHCCPHTDFVFVLTHRCALLLPLRATTSASGLRPHTPLRVTSARYFNAGDSSSSARYFLCALLQRRRLVQRRRLLRFFQFSTAGEVNRIRELPQNSNIVATHTDSPDVLVWDVETQPNRQPVLGATPSRPDLILTGHQDNAEFALAMCPTEPFVLSGGKDKSVVLWSIHDHVSSLAADQGAHKSPGSKGSSANGKAGEGTTVEARGIFQGHSDTVEDVQFNPSSAQEFCSVGDDSCLILWDARTGTSPVVKVEKAHNADLHCVDWNPNDVNLILTGSADNTVRMYDRRNLTSGGVGAPVHIFEGHSAAVLCVQWSPAKASVFGSAAEDGILNIWDHAKIGKAGNSAGSGESSYPPGLFFKHAGHRDKVVDFHWNAADPWTIVSVSEDGEKTGGGGTLQIWRMIDLIYRPEEEVIAELDKFKSHLLTCSTSSST